MKRGRRNKINICCFVACGCLAFGGIAFAQEIPSSEEELIMRREYSVLSETSERQDAEKIQAWIQRGDALFYQHEYEQAKNCYDQALILDPSSRKILDKIKRTEKELFKTATARYEAYQEKSLADVAAQWTPPTQKVSDSQDKICVAGSQVSHLPEILRKLETIRFPVLDFHDAEISEVIQYLARKSRELDAEGKGVNFVIKLAKPESESPERLNVIKPVTVSFSLRDVSLLDVLDMIKKMTGIYYRVEEYAVLILPSSERDDSLMVRSFDVRPDFFSEEIAKEGDVRKYLENKGLPFMPGTTANYFPNTCKLVVRGTPEVLNLITNFISLEQEELPQVQIETRFVEFSEDKLDELRFRWQVGAKSMIPALGSIVIPGRAGVAAKTGGIRGTTTDPLTPQPGLTANSLDEQLGKSLPAPGIIDIGGILDGHGTRLLIDLMKRVAGGNLMAAPKITLQKGARGTVRIAREFVYPRRYSSPTIPDEDGLVIPPSPEDFNFAEPKNIGVVLKVLVEEVNSELRLIDLRLEDMQVVDFEGFINYGNPIVTINKDGALGGLINSIAMQPVFSVRRAQTSIQLRDGQTLVMGGFIRDDAQKIRDQVPVLGDIPVFGRLFQGKSDQSVKRNLIIMSTATLVKPDGANIKRSTAQNP